MLDLETFGNGSNASIVQIGGVIFNQKTGDLVDQICLNINLPSNTKFNRDIDAKTVAWWISQSKEAQNTLDLEKGLALDAALKLFSEFIKHHFGDVKPLIWSHSTFDFVILSNAYSATEVRMPFSHRCERDLRTVTDLGGEHYWEPDYPEVRVGVHHNALDDCLFQIKYCVKAYNKSTAWKTTN